MNRQDLTVGGGRDRCAAWLYRAAGGPSNAPLIVTAPMLCHTKIDMCSELVGMAGFEPAASCSQIRSGLWPGVARDSQRTHLAAVIMARRGPMLPHICRHWLPLLAPPELVSLLMFESSNTVAGEVSALLYMHAVAVLRPYVVFGRRNW
jgi:hypothetical protein